MEVDKRIFKKFVYTGECELDVTEVMIQWTSFWFISQWHEKFTLFNDDIKVVIKKEQAKELIEKLGLKAEHSTIFRNGKTWRT